MSQLPQIYADFQNADSQGRIRLNCVGTVQDLSRQQIALQEGATVALYSNDANEDGGEVRLVVDGVVTYSQDEQCWVASIDWQRIRREFIGSPSESQKEPSGAVLHGSSMPEPPPARPTRH